MRRKCTRAEGISVVLVLMAAVACVCPAWAGLPKSDVAEGELAPSRVLATLWQQGGSSWRVEHVALQQGVLFVAGKPRGMVAINVKDGRTLWKHIGRMPLDVRPTLSDETVYLVEGSQVVSLEAATGRELTRAWTRIGTMTPIYPGKLSWVVGSTDDRMYGIIPGNGSMRWRQNVGGNILGTTWDGVDSVFVASDAQKLYRVIIAARTVDEVRDIMEPRRGKGQLKSLRREYTHIVWNRKFRGALTTAPTIAGKRVFIGCADFHLYSLMAENGEIERRISLNAPVTGRPVVAGDSVYASTSDGILYAVDLKSDSKSNKTRWQIPGARRVLTTTKDHVIFLRKRGNLSHVGVADRESGDIIAESWTKRYRFFVAPPEGGVFYAVSLKGDVIAIGDRAVVEARKKRAEEGAGEEE